MVTNERYEEDFKDLIQSGEINKIFDEYGNCYGCRERIAEGSIKSLVYKICSLYMQNDREVPFRCLCRQENGVSDLKEKGLNEESAEFLYNKLGQIENNFVKTRIADVLWLSKLLGKNNIKAARIAVKGYYDIIDNFLFYHSENFREKFFLSNTSHYINRVCNLVSSMKGADEQKAILDKMQKYANAVNYKPGYELYFYSCFDKISDLNFPDNSVQKQCYEKTLSIINALKETYIGSSWIQHFYELAIKFSQKLGLDESKKAALKNERAKTYEMQAQNCPNNREMLKNALLLYEDLKNNDEVTRLKLEIEKLGVPTYCEHLQSKLNIPPELIKSTIASISKKSLKEAVYTFCLLLEIPSEEKIREETQKAGSISMLFPIDCLAKDGKVVASFNSDEERLQYHMIEGLRMHFNVFYVVVIAPALKTINNEHTFSEDDIKKLVKESPFVLREYETIFAKGIYYFLREEFLEASHLLVPQVEQCLRNLLSLKVPTSTVTEDKTELYDTKIKWLLKQCVKQKIFDGDLDWVLELYLITEPLNLRNKIAHGLVGDDIARNIDAIVLCYLIFFLVFFHQSEEYFSKENKQS
ncbi:MAG: DUF4209 domain-containing protein [Holosporaceae bacterium]|jgi:hypothetical protein|nr:DUF4209 domain-containing protein [Holosporaceae bacterium]